LWSVRIISNIAIVMAPLTRMRAERPSLSPRPLNAEYYAQRATQGGLIIAEASPVTAAEFGNPGVPGIWSEHHVKGWREVVEAVHAKGGVIFLQLWHVGRVSPADAIAFGRIFISNPDLPRRLQRGYPLTPYNRATFYGGEEAGYTDYPAHDELARA
jgi:2,4-dienoyl-CoA reductase-like NADH-dependent reductase (Old Yellow Enzyme family)